MEMNYEGLEVNNALVRMENANDLLGMAIGDYDSGAESLDPHLALAYIRGDIEKDTPEYHRGEHAATVMVEFNRLMTYIRASQDLLTDAIEDLKVVEK